MSDVKMQDFLAALTDALIAEDASEPELEQLLARYDLPRQDATAWALAKLVKRLRLSFAPVQPSARFSRKLKDDLMGVPQTDLVERWRRLPARVQMAALFTLMGGFVLFLRARFSFGTPSGVAPEEARAL
jgi:hypothetical protein